MSEARHVQLLEPGVRVPGGHALGVAQRGSVAPRLLARATVAGEADIPRAIGALLDELGLAPGDVFVRITPL